MYQLCLLVCNLQSYKRHSQSISLITEDQIKQGLKSVGEIIDYTPVNNFQGEGHRDAAVIVVRTTQDFYR